MPHIHWELDDLTLIIDDRVVLRFLYLSDASCGTTSWAIIMRASTVAVMSTSSALGQNNRPHAGEGALTALNASPLEPLAYAKEKLIVALYTSNGCVESTSKTCRLYTQQCIHNTQAL